MHRKKVRMGVGCETGFFKPAIKLIQVNDQLLIRHSAVGWCLVVGYVEKKTLACFSN